MTDFGGEAPTRYWSRGKLIATIGGMIAVFVIVALVYVIAMASGNNTALEEAAEPPAANAAP
jgi:hypothetical protein